MIVLGLKVFESWGRPLGLIDTAPTPPAILGPLFSYHQNADFVVNWIAIHMIIYQESVAISCRCSTAFSTAISDKLMGD